MLLLGVAVGVVAFVAARDTTIDFLRDRNEDSSARQPASDRNARDTVPLRAARVPVSTGELAWSMRSVPARQTVSVPTPDGGTMPSTVWAAEAASSGRMSGDLAIVYELGGRQYDLELGLDGAIAANGGEIIEGPSPVTVAGQPGKMVTATFERAGASGIMRLAGARFGDRVLLVGVMEEGTSRTGGQQRFADIVASARST